MRSVRHAQQREDEYGAEHRPHEVAEAEDARVADDVVVVPVEGRERGDHAQTQLQREEHQAAGFEPRPRVGCNATGEHFKHADRCDGKLHFIDRGLSMQCFLPGSGSIKH